MLGRPRVAELAAGDPAELLDDAWTALERQFLAWGGAAQRAALGIVAGVVGGIVAAERATLELRQADDLAGAWRWMRDALAGLALGLLFDPSPGVQAGELDPTSRVPAGLVRQVVARAGGAAALIASDGGGAWVTLTDAGTRPAGGIGTGDRLRDVLRDHGAGVDGYRWVYGPALRETFPPHARLDGRAFVNFDDPVLTNGTGWPPFGFYMPGDHAGCLCDAEPHIIPPAEG